MTDPCFQVRDRKRDAMREVLAFFAVKHSLTLLKLQAYQNLVRHNGDFALALVKMTHEVLKVK